MLNKIKTFFKNRLNIAITIVLLCSFIGIVGCSMLIENYLHTDMNRQRNITLDIDIINKTGDSVTIDKEKDKIKVYINENKNVNSKTPNKISVGRVIPDIGVNIRIKPTIDSNVVTSLTYDTKVDIYGEDNGWYKTDKGYIRKDLIKIIYIK